MILWGEQFKIINLYLLLTFYLSLEQYSTSARTF